MRSPRKAEAVNDERCDRDRVTAIEAAIAKQLERDYYPVAPAIAKSVMRTPALLEALDTIDRVNALFAGGPDTSCRTVWDGEIECVSVPIEDLRQALNGGNESGDDR